MKKLLLHLLLVLLATQSLFAQFHRFYKASGFAISPAAVITHIAGAGGGVVLQGVARPKSQDSLAMFTNITFTESKGISLMSIQTSGKTISFSDSTWIMRDAAMLVKSERSDEMYRDVNLFGSSFDRNHSSDEYFNVELADSLKRTKSGEILILTDLILTTKGNTKYYCSNQEACDMYLASKDSIVNIVQTYNDSVEELKYKPANDVYSRLKSADSLRQAGKLDSNEIDFLNKIKQYSFYHLFSSNLGIHFYDYGDTVGKSLIDSLFDFDNAKPAEFRHLWNDYTYNDENVNYIFFYTGDNQLAILGEPHYTFLYNDGYDDLKVDSLYTGFFIDHPDLIKNINYKVIEGAEHFGKSAAFYRYLKNQYPKLWIQVFAHFLHTKKQNGETPKFIGKYPDAPSDLSQ
jgi:hypothetical protein